MRDGIERLGVRVGIERVEENAGTAQRLAGGRRNRTPVNGVAEGRVKGHGRN